MQQSEAAKYPWVEELEKTVVQSLATSFGLDFLLFNDKLGGEVDTVNNVRQRVWATEQEKQRYEKQEAYNSYAYHQHKNYIDTGIQNKQLQQDGKLHDHYRNSTLANNEKRNLDHVISAKEVHDDAGRILAEQSGVELANQSSNLQSTHETINKSKNQTSVNDYLSKLPSLVDTHKETLFKDRQRLANIPRNTPEQQHKARELENKIRKNEDKIKQLESIDVDKMRQRDHEARAKYNQQINYEYYTSSKFLKQTASVSGMAGLNMGTRQMMGLVLAEIWFELREQLPKLFEKLKHNFSLKAFLNSIEKTLKNIWQRIQHRFNDFLIAFKDGFFAGVMASATTTLFNIFATTQKMAIKIIRELWGQLVKAIKLMVFNPDRLSFVDLCKAVVSILSIGAATVTGTIAYTQLLPLCNFPFGSELAAFISAFITGVVTLGLNYALLYSDMARKVWEFIQTLMPHAGTLKKFQAINAELDHYLLELGRIEFNLDVDELKEFAQQLAVCNNEIERGLLLQEEITKRDIELPYEMGTPASTRKWLSSLVK